MDDATYRAEILAAYEGEIGGEITSAILIRHLAVDAIRAEKLDLLRRLEDRVATALAPIVKRLGATPADPIRIAEDARSRALAIDTWEALIVHFGPQLDAYVKRFEVLRNAARPGDETVLDLLVAHERALIDFGISEVAGDEAGALACLRVAVG